jgi:hypothetical protein
MSSADAVRTQDIKHVGITEGRRNGDVVIKRLDTVQLGVRVVCVTIYPPAPFQIKLMLYALMTTSTFILFIV